MTGTGPKTGTCHDEARNGNESGVTGTGQETGTCHVATAHGQSKSETSLDEHVSDCLTVSGKQSECADHETGPETAQTGNEFQNPSGLLVHENGKTERSGNGSGPRMILHARPDANVEKSEKNHQRKGQDAQRVIDLPVSPPNPRHPEISRDKEED